MAVTIRLASLWGQYVASPVALPGTSAAHADGHGSTLNARETSFVEALASGASQNDAATTADISVRTARRWAHRHDITAAVHARLVGALAQARAVLAAGAVRAARSLVDMSDRTREADAPTVSAARAV